MHWIHYASSFLAISQLLFMGLFYLIYYRRHVIGRLMALFSLCLIAYIASRLPEVVERRGMLWLALNIMAIATPALLWMIARYLFVDQPRVHPFFWALIALYMALRSTGLLLYDGSQSADSLFFQLFFYLPQAIMIGFACHVVYMAWRDRGGDLIEQRRRLRIPLALGMGSVIIAILASGLFRSGSLMLDSIYFLALFVLALFVNLATSHLQRDFRRLLQAGDAPAGAAVEEPQAVPEKAVDRELIERIRSAMEEDRLYAQSGLTIGDFADQLGIQEYRLRRVINQTMHYRNFNQYLNSYRIREAARRLRDPKQAPVSISTIALDVGYVSLSSFNKAFKETHGVTPSAYRVGGEHGA